MSFPASFVKLDDGTWGVRIPSPSLAKAGDVVAISTRAGGTKYVTLAEPRGRNRYGDTLWSVVPQAAAAQASLAVGQLTGVLALFAKAKTHLKRPAIVLCVPEVDQDNDLEGWGIRLTIAGPKAKVPGSLTVTTDAYETTNDYGEPARAWLGRVTVEGEYQPARAANGRTDAIARRLGELARDPAKIAAEHGRLTGKCCFCNRALSDERSTAVGYGETCAKHYGVAWGSKPATFAGEAV
jgi:hypothetical protein